MTRLYIVTACLTYMQSAVVLWFVAQSHLTLCNHMDCTLLSSSIHRDSPDKNTEVGCHALLQGNIPNPGLQANSLPSKPPGNPKNSGVDKPIPSPGDLPDPGIEQGSPVLHVDSLQAEIPGKPYMQSTSCKMLGWMNHKLESRVP